MASSPITAVVTSFGDNNGRIALINNTSKSITSWHLLTNGTNPIWIMGMKRFSAARNEWIVTQSLAGGLPPFATVDVPYIGPKPLLVFKTGRPPATPVPFPSPSPSPSPAPSPTPVPAPAPAPSPTPTPVPAPAPAPGTLTKVFFPYVDILLWPTPSINKTYQITGQNHYCLAFITTTSDGKSPAWGGVIPLKDKFYAEEVAKIKAAGGTITISCGGAVGDELATKITDPVALQAAYQSIIDTYQPDALDLDLEGAFMLSDQASIDRRNKVMVKLQAANPNLKLTYCLPVMPQGLDHLALNIMKNAKENGVKPHSVGLMTFDYGSWGWQGLDPQTQMGQMAINACTAVKAQLDALGLTYKGIVMINMIGKTDVANEYFTLKNAEECLAFAKATPWMVGLSFWSLGRDKPGSIGSASPTASGIDAPEYAFTNIFKSFSV